MRPEQEKNPRDQIWFIICAPNLIRIPISGLNQGKMRKFQSNHLFILLLQAETEIRHFTQKLHVQIENKPRSPQFQIIT
jgi:hypothetical protein